MSATRRNDSIARQGVLYMALELSEKTWKLGFATGLGQEPRQRDIPARAVLVLEREIQAAKERFGLPPEAPVVSCYEAGRDGFWLHRCLLATGVENVVVESSSIEVDRDLPKRLKKLRLWDGSSLPADLHQRLVRATFRAWRQAAAANRDRGAGKEAAGGLVEVPGNGRASRGCRTERLAEQSPL